jgi:acetyl-CoA synthetase
MKLGAVIMPATTALAPKDLADRVGRAAVRHVITKATMSIKFAEISGDFGRMAIGDAPPPWRRYRLADTVVASALLGTQTSADDPMLIYFTSSTTSRPKLVEHTHRSYPVGHLSTMYLLGLRPGDVHLNISSPGWAKHAWSSFFAPWIAESTIVVYNYTRFDAPRFLTMLRQAEVTSLCAPPAVWRMLIQSDLGARPTTLREAVGGWGAAEPGGHLARSEELGGDYPRRVRADRDHGVDRQYPAPTGQARFDGPTAARCCRGDRRLCQRAAGQRG